MNQKNNLLVLTYWSYKDPLIQTYTLPYVKIIKKNLSKNDHLYLLTIEQEHLKMSRKEWVNEKIKFQKQNIHLLRFKYTKFGMFAIFNMAYLFFHFFLLIFRKKISVIHAWCTPAGALGYFLSKATGKKLILDSYEPHAESMVENGTWKRESLAFKILWWFENKQSKRAYTVIATTSGMKKYSFEKYNINLEHFFVKPSCVDLDLFNPNSIKDKSLLGKFDIENKMVCIYAGKIGGIYLDHEIFDFFKVAFNYFENKFCVIMLTNTDKKIILKRINEHQLNSKNFFIKFVSHEEINKYMNLANFAINPVKPVPTKKYCTSIKDGEYWAMGLPVIIPDNISDDSNIITENNIGYVLKSFNDLEYKKAISYVDSLIQQKEIKDNIRAIAIRYRNFSIAEKIYKNIYSNS